MVNYAKFDKLVLDDEAEEKQEIINQADDTRIKDIVDASIASLGVLRRFGLWMQETRRQVQYGAAIIYATHHAPSG